MTSQRKKGARTKLPQRRAEPRRQTTSARRRRAPLIIVAIIAFVAGAILIRPLVRHWQKAKHSRESTPISPSVSPVQTAQQEFPEYAGSNSCRDCHRSEYDRWAQSHHGLAERRLRPDIDKPAFDPPRTFHHGTQDSQVRIRDGQYQVMTVDLSKKMTPQTVKRVIGVDPLRQFLVEAERGRMQTLEATYDPNKNEWFNVYGSEDRQPGEWGHWTGRGMTWNSMCASCHNTRVRKNYDEPTDSYHTTMAEMSVSCEACHGPMKDHLQWQHKYQKAGKKDPTLSHPSRDQIIDTCGTCHSRHAELTGDFVPGQPYFDHFVLEGVNETDLFYPDGQIHDEDYELSAFLGSKMHAAGVRCIDCHDVHSGKTLLEGNALCMKCHTGTYPKAPIINLATHTFHKFDSAGSQCVNCHMPQTTYMQRHSRHDHGFTIPDPLLTKQTGTPNACNRCHADKNTDWALVAADTWYGAKLDRPSRHRALAIAAARNGDALAAPQLLALLDDTSQTFYWKSAFVRLLGRWVNDPTVLAALVKQLHADRPMVRECAVLALLPVADHPDVENALRAMLDDPFRNVRIAAVISLGNQVDPNIPAAQEFLKNLPQQGDRVEGQLQLARYEASRQNEKGALAHLTRALELDHTAGVRAGVGTIYADLRHPVEALDQFREAVRLDPNNADLQYNLALVAAGLKKQDEALVALEKTVQLDPRRPRAWYNLALARTNAGKPDAALEAYNRAEALDPSDPDIPYGLATLLIQLNRPGEARAAFLRVRRIRPDYRPPP